MVTQRWKKQRKVKKIRSDINEIVKRRHKSEEQKSAIKSITTLYES